MNTMRRAGFTLIELLVVIAVIANPVSRVRLRARERTEGGLHQQSAAAFIGPPDVLRR